VGRRRRPARAPRLGGAPAVRAPRLADPPAPDGAAEAPPPPELEPAAEPAAGVCHVETLAPEASLAAAAEALRAAVRAAPARFAGASAGLLRFEVPVPRGVRALWWLRGQEGADDARSGTLAPALAPRVYFSPRRSAAPDTEGSRAAGAASAGASAVAGAGAAWLWRGAPGAPLDAAALASMRRFLAAGPPRARVFGGARFDAAGAPAPEWAEYGAYYFVLPRLELAEAAGCGLLSVNVAWDAGHVPGAAAESAGGVGYASLEAAAAAALAALAAARPPAPPSAGAPRGAAGPERHLPDEAGWRRRLETAHARLRPVAPAPSSAAGAAGAGVSPDAALREFMLGGQQGLDELLAALDGGGEALLPPPQSPPLASASSSDEERAAAAADAAATKKGGPLTKVVLARRTDIDVSGRLAPASLLEALQERDPRAYQCLLHLPSGAAFLASTPERLYARTGAAVASEAVAGTRPRGAGGDVVADFWLALELLRSEKDGAEFSVVRDWVAAALGRVCARVEVEVAKSVVKQGGVQHLYGRLAGTLRPGGGDGDARLLAALHPTPAVCGQPRRAALAALRAAEPFDRGLYAGPFGWVAADAAEFVVAIRSALVRPSGGGGEGGGVGGDADAAAAAGDTASASFPEPSSRPDTAVSLFAGVGIVSGSDVAAEWAELDLKVAQYRPLLAPSPPLAEAPNAAAAAARAAIEELCRLGCSTFALAPGSRSSPLAAAAAAHPRARLVPALDERSLGFWALGHGRAGGRPAVLICSSGTAVANLLPAVVEASMGGVPLVLLTADRPAELRGTGANQTIAQPGIFGGYVRWEADLAPAADSGGAAGAPARAAVAAVGEGVRRALGLGEGAAAGGLPGPVHINWQFSEPLAPAAAPWDRGAALAGLAAWEAGGAPLGAPPPPPPGDADGPAAAAAAALAAADGAAAVLDALARARRGLIVAGELRRPEDAVGAARLARALGWPLAPDALSGLRAGAAPPGGGAPLALVPHFDQALAAGPAAWRALRPDVVLQLGGRVTSKRTAQFVEWAARGAPPLAGEGEGAAAGGGAGDSALGATTWVFVDRAPLARDQGPAVSRRLAAPLPALAAAAAARLAARAAAGGAAAETAAAQAVYTALLLAVEAEAGAAVAAALAALPDLSEPAVARLVAAALPPGEGLFLGNSMPVRDADAFGLPRGAGSLFDGDSAFATAPSGLASSSDSSLAAAEGQGAVGAGVGAPVAANRGASGIDGVLSTAAGFAHGLGAGATLVLGDLSFLHDAGGLALLRGGGPGEARPPLTVVLVNNGGGGIFSFLPVAEALPPDVFEPLWATPQHVDVAGLCRAHGVPHVRVADGAELAEALRAAWGLNRHSVVEVATERGANVAHHRAIAAAAAAAVEGALGALLPAAGAALAYLAPGDGDGGGAALEAVVAAASYARFALPLARPLTTGVGGAGARRGLRLRLELRAGGRVAVGEGEVAPLPGLHRESLAAAERQAALVCALLRGARVPVTAALLGGRLEAWLVRGAGLDAPALLPSVRAGLEFALLSALAEVSGVSLARLLATAAGAPADAALAPPSVCALLDSVGPPEEAAAEAAALVAAGARAVKLKAGRRASPEADAAAARAVRAAVGSAVALRADANRRWGVGAAAAFAAAAAPAGLEFLEEPVAGGAAALEELARAAPTMCFAFDESVDEGALAPGAPPPPRGLAAAVLKPSALGGPERALAAAAVARAAGAAAVVSSAFESPAGLAQLAALASALDAAAGAGAAEVHHGLGTAGWFAAGAAAVAEEPVAAPVLRASRVRVRVAAGEYEIGLLEALPVESSSNGNGGGNGNGSASAAAAKAPLVFLHGFLGAAEEWAPHLRTAAAGGRRAAALDLPGHGATRAPPGAGACGLEAAADAAAAAIAAAGLAGCVLVGYSLGARCALLVAARHPGLLAGVVSISGGPGLAGAEARAARAAADAADAVRLRAGGAAAFAARWYAAPMWAPFLRGGRAAALVAARAARGDAAALARALAGASPGRAPWALPALEAAAAAGCLPPLLLLAGELDPKFVGLAEGAAAALCAARAGAATARVVPGAGHALPSEAPLALLAALEAFLGDA
jgi:isochorismate synthase/2-succinyl-5-enolpyruvyl-6-hydroxy-3-cyclohexene-1-carboxylate synthase/2-succinyl-6-hydroxy-2,4-cyclohexadiene-1-carboxylate synthase/O-succinylbenzoate synthase